MDYTDCRVKFKI
ncbi:hypothetical protein Zm00014a_022075 [Zea mays]|uniref:Uncharacterized protein n=1 Tax=Zea mays TaxID=4577 RepID=A0A3L6FK93_MAIZE|nr:hypothetical protein Zm00014a_022075 [Zea mays]